MADVEPPDRRLLVANRGEIARRIFRTAREMGIATAAYLRRRRREAPFVREADLAVALDGRTSAETYLDIAKCSRPARAPEPTPSIPATGSWPRTRPSPRR